VSCMCKSALVERVRTVRGLDPASRLVLMEIAREVPAGANEVLVNRTKLAERLEAPAALVAKAIRCGERIGLVSQLRDKRLAFVGVSLFGEATVPAHGAVKATAAPATEANQITGGLLRDEFRRQWQAAYGRPYRWDYGKEDKEARELARSFESRAELVSEVRRYFVHPDQFFHEREHPFALLRRAMNSGGRTGEDRRSGERRGGGRIMDEDETRRYLRGER
jgi:hypothetical protein